MDEHKVCAKHDATMDRLFSTINEIKQQQSEMIAGYKTIAKFAEDIHKIVYGNGQEGLISKVRRVLSQMNLQWALLILILGAIIGYAIRFLAIK